MNIGSRQQNRSLSTDIINCGYEKMEILNAIVSAQHFIPRTVSHFGEGNSAKMCLEILKSSDTWNISKQKRFNDF